MKTKIHLPMKMCLMLMYGDGNLLRRARLFHVFKYKKHGGGRFYREALHWEPYNRNGEYTRFGRFVWTPRSDYPVAARHD